MADLYIVDRSEYILKRMVLLHNWQAPTISDAKRNFGDDLAEKIFCNCDDSFREDFGLEPPLKGPMGRDLWSSPSDLLIGKVCLKPPFTSKHIRALTHQGILKIGLKIEKLFWNQMEIEKSKELEEQERTLKLLCETAKREAINYTRSVMMDNFRSERLDIVTEMENIFREELRKMEDEYRDKIEEKLEEQAETMKNSFQAMLEEQKLKNNEIVPYNPSIDLDEIERTLQAAFQTYFQKSQIHANFKIQAEQAKCKERLKSLRHELECKNLANLMYVMCMERKKCNYENSLVKTELAEEINTLNGLLQDRNKETEKLVAEKDDLQKHVDLRESALSKVIEEFQKFIYFALKAEPKQAEYLLSGEKLLLLELANELSKVNIPKEEDDDHDRNYLWDKTPPRSDSTEDSLRVKDGHNCLREPEITESELSVKQFLPGFHYNDQLFVREDFRNMISQGIRIDSNDMLWTKDLQDIQDQMELLDEPSALDDSKSLTKKAPTERKKSLISFQSSVHFSIKEKDKSSLTSEDQDKRSRKASIKTVEPEDILRTVDFGHVGTEERRKTLISSRNSVELLKENILKRKSSLRLTNTSNGMENSTEEKEVLDEPKISVITKDSVVQTKMKQILTSSTGMKVLKEEEVMDPKKNISKLIAVTDSLEIIKRRNSRNSIKHIINDFPQSKLSNSEEITFQELPSDIEDNISLPLNEPPRRVSIVFTGKSLIYDEQNENQIKQQNLKPKPREKQKRKQPKKFITRQNKKSFDVYGTHKTIGSDLSRSNAEAFSLDCEYIQQATKLNSLHLFNKYGTNKILPGPTIQKRDVPKFTEQIVMGDSKFKFHQQNEEQFSNERIHSFLNIIKEHPNLIRLFTSVTR